MHAVGTGLEPALRQREAQAVAKDVPAEEVERAKSAAVSAILMNLESRAVTNEDIGRQILTYGHRCELHLRHWPLAATVLCGEASG